MIGVPDGAAMSTPLCGAHDAEHGVAPRVAEAARDAADHRQPVRARLGDGRVGARRRGTAARHARGRDRRTTGRGRGCCRAPGCCTSRCRRGASCGRVDCCARRGRHAQRGVDECADRGCRVSGRCHHRVGVGQHAQSHAFRLGLDRRGHAHDDGQQRAADDGSPGDRDERDGRHAEPTDGNPEGPRTRARTRGYHHESPPIVRLAGPRGATRPRTSAAAARRRRLERHEVGCGQHHRGGRDGDGEAATAAGDRGPMCVQRHDRRLGSPRAMRVAFHGGQPVGVRLRPPRATEGAASGPMRRWCDPARRPPTGSAAARAPFRPRE